MTTATLPSKTRSSRAPARCPLCLDVLKVHAVRRCYGCQTRYHVECLADLGAGCAKTHCVGRVLGPRIPPSGRTRLRPKERPARRPLSWRERLRVWFSSPWIGPGILAGAGIAIMLNDDRLLALLASF